MILNSIDWQKMFVPSASVVELFLRGTIMYFFILALMRLFRREAGTLSIPDLLVVVLVADAAQNGMSSEYHSVTEGLVLVGTIFLWNYGLDWLSYRSRRVYRLLHPAPLPLVKDGAIQRRNLRSELLTVDDLLSQLREHGVDDVRAVKRSYIEPDGHLSVIKFESDTETGGQSDRTRGLA
jgi:uncharacterized membrane protein YcaP (DUF421 family)